MPETSAALRRFALAAALVAGASSSGCLDAIAPTPTSSLVAITPINRWTRGEESESGSRFFIELRIRNAGSRTIFLDRLYGRTEKLIDQKWELAIETTTPPFGTVRSIPPNQSITIGYLVQYVPGVSPDSPYLEHLRGLYRVRLRLSYSSNGTDLLPPEDSYSQPFAVD